MKSQEWNDLLGDFSSVISADILYPIEGEMRDAHLETSTVEQKNQLDVIKQKATELQGLITSLKKG